MEDNLIFTNNWNNKLNCKCFTTLRLHNQQKYYRGAIKNVMLKDVSKGKAVIVGVQSFMLSQVSEYVARIDTGLNAKECQQMIKSMYKKYAHINWNVQLLDFVLLEYERREKEPNLFENEIA